MSTGDLYICRTGSCPPPFGFLRSKRSSGIESREYDSRGGERLLPSVRSPGGWRFTFGFPAFGTVVRRIVSGAIPTRQHVHDIDHATKISKIQYAVLFFFFCQYRLVESRTRDSNIVRKCSKENFLRCALILLRPDFCPAKQHIG